MMSRHLLIGQQQSFESILLQIRKFAALKISAARWDDDIGQREKLIAKLLFGKSPVSHALKPAQFWFNVPLSTRNKEEM